MTDHDISLDVGFDREANTKPGSGEYAGLVHGFTFVSEPGNPVSLARRLRIGERLILTLYDLTGPAGQSTTPVDYLSLSLVFSKAREQHDLQPLEPLGPPFGDTVAWESFHIFRALADSGYSTVFEADHPSWNVHRPGEGAASYPGNQLAPDRQPPQATFEIARGGYFYFTLLLEARWPDASGAQQRKLYREDPEMIIDTT